MSEFKKENYIQYPISTLRCTGILFLPIDKGNICWLITDCFLCKGDSLKFEGYDLNVNGTYEVIKSLTGCYKLEKIYVE